jgi:hypothetical protein
MPVLRRKNPPYIPPGVRSPVKVNAETGEIEPAFRISPPGWKDFIKIDPVLGTTEEQIKKQKKEIATRISSSPTPEVVKALASVLTAVDDMQDAAVTASVIGRVAVKFFPRLLPVVGPIALFADLLNLAGQLLPAGLLNAFDKKDHEAAGLAGPGTYQRRLSKTVRTGKVGLGWGEVFQGLQTTANLVGVGLEIGSALGYAYDVFFGLIRGGEFLIPVQDPETFNPGVEFLPASDELAITPRQRATIKKVIERRGAIKLSTFGALGFVDQVLGLPPGMSDVKIQEGVNLFWSAAENIGASLADLAPTMDDFSFEQHLAMSTYGLMAGQIVADISSVIPWEPIVKRLADDFEIAPRVSRNEATRALIREHGQDPDRPRFALAGSPERLPFREYLAETREAYQRAWPVWARQAPTEESSSFCLSVLNESVDVFSRGIEFPGTTVEVAYTALQQAIINLAELKPSWGTAFSAEDLARGLEALAARLDPPRIVKLSLDETVRLLGLRKGG